ncbi:uncharacterized protein JCM6883_003550 [Sporobolomyces salmoneus]|uniref:uncharacterized protein n=1 Tax=Sporobolomyces salmoneus TaxID=183962 RepID=UPI00316F8969
MPTPRAQPKSKPLEGTWSPSPSPSPPPSPGKPVDLSISDSDRFQLLESHSALKSSDLDAKTANGQSPLVVVSPEELEKMVEKQKRGEVEVEGEGEEEEEEAELLLWEEIANAVLWSIPFGFLFSGMDYAVHAQFGQDLIFKEELGRIFNILPALFLLNFSLSRPPSKALLRPSLLQFLLFVLCIATGVTLVQVTTQEGYLNVMRQAPALGVLWCWSVVRMDLGWAVAALVGVGAGVWARGQGESLMWWRNL